MNKKKFYSYGLFTNTKKNKTLCYYPVPKNANTSAKLFFAKHLGIEDRLIHTEKPLYKIIPNEDFKGKTPVWKWLPSKNAFVKQEVDYACCLTRNPIKRFISSYKNRILYHKDREFYNHSIDMVLDKIEKNNFENKHFLPQNYFLGKDINYFSIISNTNNIKIFEEKVNDFFGKRVSFPHLQTGGSDIDINVSALQIKRIEKIYQEDFELFKL